jgi:hypothetical protein
METYQEKLKELQNTFCEGASNLLTIHINHIIKKYGNWNKYPRKIKKFLKKKLWWDLRNSELIKDGELLVKVII